MRTTVTDRAILEILEFIYEASCDPAQWPVAAEHCQRLLPGVAFSLLISLEGAGYDPLPVTMGWDPNLVQQYKDYYYKVNTYSDVLRSVPPGKVVRASQFVTRRWQAKQEFFNDWLKPAGNFTHGANVTLVRATGGLTRLSYDVPERLSELEGEAADVLRRIGPHFSRALETTRQFGGLRAAAGAFAALLEQVEGAAIAVDRHGKVSFANRQGLAMMEKEDLVRETRAGLVFVSQPAHELFKRAILTCASIIERPAATSFMTGEGNRRPVHVLPLRLSHDLPSTGIGSPMALVLIGPDSGLAVSVDDLLKKLFRLSPREAQVVVRIASGATVRQAADEFELSSATVRNQLATAMVKLGVHRRAELVTLLAGLVPRFLVRGPDR